MYMTKFMLVFCMCSHTNTDKSWSCGWGLIFHELMFLKHYRNYQSNNRGVNAKMHDSRVNCRLFHIVASCLRTFCELSYIWCSDEDQPYNEVAGYIFSMIP